MEYNVTIAVAAGMIVIWSVLITAKELGRRSGALQALLTIALAAAVLGAVPSINISPKDAAFLVSCAALALAIAWIDAKHQIIPDLLILPLVGLALLSPLTPDPIEKVIGATLIGGLFAGVRYGHAALQKREGLGLGDVKYAAALGALLGVEPSLYVVLAATLSGAVVLLIKHSQRALPLGVCLSAAFGVVLPLALLGLL